jgi:hypothetical protein
MKIATKKDYAETFERLSDEFRKAFGFSKPEGIIQSYSCSYGGIKRMGTLFISQNYVCFQGSKEQVKIPFIRIKDVNLSSGWIEIQTDTAIVNHSFGWFKLNGSKLAYYIILHMWKNPPNYIDVLAYREAAAKLDRSQEEEAIKHEAQVKKKLDVNKAKEIEQLANETEAMQNETIQQIEDQTDTINRIEGKLEDINDEMKRAVHLMKGIESLSYYMFSGGTKMKDFDDKRKKKNLDRTFILPEGSSPVIEIDALFKNEHLQPCIVVFNAQNFEIINPKTNKLFNSGNQYSYYDVEEITIRTRNEHIQISFNTKKKPLIELCTAYRQIITNQFYRRAKKKGHDIKVKFQHGSYKFDYHDEWLYKLPAVKRGTGTGMLSVSETTFGRLSELFTDRLIRSDADAIDRTLDRVSDTVSNIIQKGQAMNQEITQQTERLKNLEVRTDTTVDKTRNIGVKMDIQG